MEILRESLKEDVTLIVDAEKDLLLKILKYHPFLIKPNILELGAMFDVVIQAPEDVLFLYKGTPGEGCAQCTCAHVKRRGDFVG